MSQFSFVPMSQKSRVLAKLFNMCRVGMRSNEFQKFGQIPGLLGHWDILGTYWYSVIYPARTYALMYIYIPVSFIGIYISAVKEARPHTFVG